MPTTSEPTGGADARRPVPRAVRVLRELVTVLALYLALMLIPGLFLLDAIWNRGRLVTLLFG